MNYNEFTVISNYFSPVLDQGPVLIKADTMARIPSVQTERLCDLFFQGRDYVLETRNDIFRARKAMWNMPFGWRGRRTVNDVFDSLH